MRRTIEIVLVLLGFFAVVAWLFKPDDPIREPIAAILGTTSFASLLDLFLPRPTEAEKDERREQRNLDFRTALDRIKHEWNHLEGMRQNPTQYAGKSYAEETPLELINRDISPLAKYWGLGQTVRKAQAEIKRNVTLPTGNKDVRSLVTSLTTIRTKLNKRLS